MTNRNPRSSTSPPRRLSLVIAGGLLVASGTVGCESTPSPDLDVVTKARLTSELRREAEDCLQRFYRDTTKLEELECYIEKHRLTTVMHPSPRDCPKCYFNYGRGLSLMGGYYLTLAQKFEQVSDEEVPDRLERAREARAKMEEYFRESNQMFEAYFSTGLAYPVALDLASRQYAMLGDYNRALRYLDQLVQSQKFGERDQKVIDQRRKRYEFRLRQQQEAAVRQELGRFDGAQETPREPDEPLSSPEKGDLERDPVPGTSP